MLSKEQLHAFTERRSFLPVSMGMFVAGLLTLAPLSWLHLVRNVGSVVGRHRIALLLLALGLGGISVWVSRCWRRLHANQARLVRRDRHSVADGLSLFTHVTLLLAFAVALAAALGFVLWAVLGRPSLAPSMKPNVSAPVTSVPAAGWTVANTFDAIKIVLAVVAGIGGIVALTVRYREQDVGEAAEHREDTKLFTERFTTAAEQLGSTQAAVRLAGVYAMARLADDWPEERQTCIDVLCAYLRMPYSPPTEQPSPRTDLSGGHTTPTAAAAEVSGATPTGRDPHEERQVRHTVIRLIAAHLQPDAKSNWQGRHFDFTGVVFDGGNFNEIEVRLDTTLTFTDATFSSGVVAFKGAHFSGGVVTFDYADFSGGEVTFNGATFSGAEVTFAYATFSGGEVSFDYADFSGGKVLFMGADFSGGEVNFDHAAFSGAEVTFSHAAFSGSKVSFTGATFSGSKVLFGATFSGGEVTFAHADFSGSEVTFLGAIFSGGVVDLSQPRDWSVPPTGVDGSQAGVRCPSSGYQ